MSLSRRRFIKTSSTMLLAAAVNSRQSLMANERIASEERKKIRVAVFYDSSFPSGEISSLTKERIENVLQDCQLDFLSADKLQTQLTAAAYDLFINPYGSRFPKEAFRAIDRFLLSKGNFLHLGGTPFSIPVVRENAGWKEEIRQTTFHKKFGITQSFPIPINENWITASSKSSWFDDDQYDAMKLFDQTILEGCNATTVDELYVRLTSKKEYPDEDGSDGPREACITPLLFIADQAQIRRAAPIIVLDRLLGAYAGGRWVLANYSGTISDEALRSLVHLASLGASELRVIPSHATYHATEVPQLNIEYSHLSDRSDLQRSIECQIEMMNERNERVITKTITLRKKGRKYFGVCSLAEFKQQALKNGLYRVSASIEQEALLPDGRHRMMAENGFWFGENDVQEVGSRMEIVDGSFLRDGIPFVMTGTTFMSPSVHRRFLLEPNPAEWDEQFNAMKNAGVNIVRTGIWTGWKNYMSEHGSVREEILRAIDAFLITAAKYDIHVIFTFFSFTPERWGGLNAYLDPRSIQVQKKFIRSIVRRFKDARNVLWDLINEPSFCNPQKLWMTRPNDDRFERDAWKNWLKEKYECTSDAELISQLQLRYRVSENVLSLPSSDDFDNANVSGHRVPMKVIDYRLFAQAMFERWVMEMTKEIREAIGTEHVITVGQDEGGTLDRPAPQFFGREVDFTCVHNWWFNDDLLWDNVMTKIPRKPLVVEETGVMFHETIDGKAWRTEEQAAKLLEKKLALSFTAGVSGFIQWIWNSNPYMNSDNEAAIGLHRADGTAKPEFDALNKYAMFFNKHRALMKERKDPEVCMIIPNSNLFSPRSVAVESTRRCVRAMSYHFSIPVSAISEYRLDMLSTIPKLFILPSPQCINRNAWEKLLKLVEQGSTLLITGALDVDEHGLPLAGYDGNDDAHSVAVGQEETMQIDGEVYSLSFRGEAMHRIRKSTSSQDITTTNHGMGKIIRAKLPVELADSIEPTIALYRNILRGVGIKPIFMLEKSTTPILIYPTQYQEALMLTIVSDTDERLECVLRFTETNTILRCTMQAQSSAVIFIDANREKVIDAMNVEVELGKG